MSGIYTTRAGTQHSRAPELQQTANRKQENKDHDPNFLETVRCPTTQNARSGNRAL
jgi:hypothetical protein